MPQRTVTLNYDKANPDAPFGPAPRRISVEPNDTIEFRIGASTLAAHQGCKLRITFHKGQHFSEKVLQHKGAQKGSDALAVTVKPGLAAALPVLRAQAKPVITGYKCELLDANGQPIPGLESDGPTGGEVVPDTASGN